jgi:putative ATPase
MTLAIKLRPKLIEELVGQEHLTKKGSLFCHLLCAKKPTSILFWGPPGCGKTTLAQIYQNQFEGTKITLSATSAKGSDIKALVEKTQSTPLFNQKILLFLDEIHRFNKLQQDLFLPLIEKGNLVLIGATTENPSFTLNKALLSRLNVFILNPLEEKDFHLLLKRYEKGTSLPLTDLAKEKLIELSGGDARIFYNLIESIEYQKFKEKIDADILEKSLPNILSKYDKKYDFHYFFISALHKSIRGSDVDASLYYLARILQGGEDPCFLGRRLLRMASEDIGLSDPHALELVVAAIAAYKQVGSPEGEIFLAQATVYLALSPKSNALYKAFNEAWDLAKKTSHYLPPANLLNAPTAWMKDQGFSKGYIYEHDEKEALSSQRFFPKQIDPQTFYKPTRFGFEKELQKRLEYFKKIRDQ